MTKEEYLKEKKALLDEYEANKRKLAVKYAFANNPYKVDDIIEDHMGFGRIISFKATLIGYSETPELIYHCENLTKKLTVNKREPIRNIWQSNIKNN